MRPFVRSSVPAPSGAGSPPPRGPLLLALGLATLIASAAPAAAQSSGSATPVAEPAAARPNAGSVGAEGTETVQLAVLACPSGDTDRADCEDLAGVTLGVAVDGTDLAEGPLTTRMGSIGTNTAAFQARRGAEIWVSVLDGIPEGYVFPEGSRTVLVADLPEAGCGGEAVCRELTLQLLPDPLAPPAAGTPPGAGLATVHAVVRACEPDDAVIDDCEDLAGVTLGVALDGVDLPDGPVTTELGGLGTNTATFRAPGDALVEVVVLDGVPDGYDFAPGTFRSVVFTLPEEGCGGESTCRELTIVLTPEPRAPVPDPNRAPIIDAAASFAFVADDWSGAFEEVDAEVYRRDAVAIYGAASETPSATLTFSLDAGGDGQTALTLTGLDDELAGPTPLAIWVNGELVHDGDLGFYDWDPSANEVAWQRSTLYFPSDLLRAGNNTITVENLADSAAVGEPPYLLLSEAFVAVDVGGVG